MDKLGHILPSVNAALNATACVLLVLGLRFIKRGRVQAHKRTMLACFAVSCVFLACYLLRRAITGDQPFPMYPPTAVRYGYYALLASHVILALFVPFLAIITIWLGLSERFATHKKLARWTYPIWLYVSVTGVLVYLMLYQAFPAPAG